MSRTLAVLAACALAVGLAACSSPAPNNDFVVHRTGTGPATITFSNPERSSDYLAGPVHFASEFTCSAGVFDVRLKHSNPVIYESGTECNPGGGGYDMPLPSQSKSFTFTIDVPTTTTWTFDGTFSTKSSTKQ